MYYRKLFQELGLAVLMMAICTIPVIAQEEAKTEGTGDLAKKAQNPISDLISVPFQNNFNFGVGPGSDMQYILNIQPVIPQNLGDWNWVHRAIIPIMYQPEMAPGVGDTFGLGDIMYQGYLSPAHPDKIIWGVGPVVVIPSATDNSLGQDKLSMGPVVGRL